MVNCFLWCNEDHFLGFADCLCVLVNELLSNEGFCESDERLSQFYHQTLRRFLLKIKYESERRFCTPVSPEDISVGASKVSLLSVFQKTNDQK